MHVPPLAPFLEPSVVVTALEEGVVESVVADAVDWTGGGVGLCVCPVARQIACTHSWRSFSSSVAKYMLSPSFTRLKKYAPPPICTRSNRRYEKSSASKAIFLQKTMHFTYFRSFHEKVQMQYWGISKLQRHPLKIHSSPTIERLSAFMSLATTLRHIREQNDI